MAQQYTTDSGVTLTNPGTYVDAQVKSSQTNVPVAGVVTIIGEAEEGPAWTSESDIENVEFTPDQFDRVLSKYSSGRLVDAFREVISAANDPSITGGVSLVRMLKTNASVSASAIMARNGFGTFASFAAKREGISGNTIKYGSAVSVAEVAPESGSFSYTPHYGLTAISFYLRANGLSRMTIALNARVDGPSFVALLNSYVNGILATGGDEVLPLSGITAGSTLSAALSGSNLVVSLPSGMMFSGSPEIGDTVVLPANTEYSAAQDSCIAGTLLVNCAAFTIRSISNTVTSATMTLQRVNGGGTLASTSGVVSADKRDMVLYKPVNIKNKTGQNRQSLVGMVGTFTCTSNDGSIAVLSTPTGVAWASTPLVGDICILPTAFASIAAGFYSVSAATTTSVTLVRLSNGTAGTTGTEVIATPIVAGSEPFTVNKPAIDGIGKSLEIAGSVGSIFRNPSTGAAASLSNVMLTSASELKNAFTVGRGSVSNTFAVGGDIVIKVNCTTADATMEVAADAINFRIAGVTQWSAPFSSFTTLNDLISFINSHAGFTAAIAQSKFLFWPLSRLDKGTFGISGISGLFAGRIKGDAYAWNALVAGNPLVNITMTATAGLPEAFTGSIFLAGGVKGATSAAAVAAAIDKLEEVSTNFIVPCFSKDAIDDIVDGETDSASTYTIDGINEYLKAHVITMSQMEQRKNRIAIGSKYATYADVKEAAGNMSSFRFAMAFEEVKVVSGGGASVWRQPWMAAIVAAGMQAAAGYKGIVKKFANISGIRSPFGDFNYNKSGDVKDALQAGLLVIERVATGGYRFVSDQMTYSVDSNFVYNSLQAVYLSDLMTLTLIDRFDRLVVGRSVAEMTATGARSILETEMTNFRRLRWISPSDDAPAGYKNVIVRLNGGVMAIAVEVKLAGLIYFVPISLTISEVSQTA